jgi:predicted dehydrogenase
MPSSPLRIGLLGASRVATYAVIAPARDEPRAEVVAVAARDPERARAYAAEHGISRVLAGYEALAADPAIDLVYVGTPPALHRAHVELALAHGKPVLCEKPFALDAAEADAMLQAARRAGLPLFEAMHSRHHPLFARVVELVRGGAIGAVRSIDARFDIDLRGRPDDFRWQPGAGGGALMDLGVYPLSWARGVVGEEPAVARASMRMVGGVDAAVEAELRFPGGVEARIHSAMDAPGRTAELVVVGSGGRITAINPLAPQLGHGLVVEAEGGTREEQVPGPSSYAAQLGALCAALLDGAPWPLPADDPLRSMVAIDAVRAAASA